MINDLKEIVAINSVEAPQSAVDAPFGQNLRNALDWFLNKASSYGLKVGERDGYCGWADYGDRELPLIGILAHVDIVPAGEGWTSDPFTLREEDGVLYGRGTSDDKGALVAVLHVLKRMREEKKKLRHRIRLIVGCNEETGSRCLQKYASECEIPVVSLVPDADFPVINSEKGILHTDVEVSVDETFKQNISALYAGERANVVPGKATVKFTKDSEVIEELRGIFQNINSNILDIPEISDAVKKIKAKFSDYEIVDGEEGVTITATGVAGHASVPETADNALWKIFAILRAIMPQSTTVKIIFDKLCTRDCTKILGINVNDERTGVLTMNMGVADYQNDTLTLKFDFRLPITATPDLPEIALTYTFGEMASVHRVRFSENLYVPEDSPLIKTLLKVYCSVTGKRKVSPLQIGGGTYARELPNAVAFGPTPPKRQTNIHNADECVYIEDLELTKEVYYRAIEELDKLY